MTVSGRHLLVQSKKLNLRSFAQNYGSRLLTLRQNLRFFRCRLFSASTAKNSSYPYSQTLGQLLFSLHSSYTSIGSMSSPFPCNSGWGSELRFACATVRALITLPVPTILPSKTGLYDIHHHLNLTLKPLRRSYPNSSRYHSDFSLGL